jgi:hypothetical protein
MEKEGVGIDKGEECCLLGINMADHPPFQGFFVAGVLSELRSVRPPLGQADPLASFLLFRQWGGEQGSKRGYRLGFIFKLRSQNR